MKLKHYRKEKKTKQKLNKKISHYRISEKSLDF